MVGLVPCVRKVASSNPTLAAGPWASPSLVVVCSACVNSDTVSMLCREHLRVVVDLKRRHRNIWMNG